MLCRLDGKVALVKIGKAAVLLASGDLIYVAGIELFVGGGAVQI